MLLGQADALAGRGCLSLLLLLVIASGCRARDDGIDIDRTGGRGGGGAGQGGRGTGGRGGSGPGGGGMTTDAAPGSGGSRPQDGAGDTGDAPRDWPAEPVAEVPPDRPPDLPPDLPVEVPPRSKPDGAPCAASIECLNNVCSKGICCNKACDDPCFSCTRAGNGVVDGRCEINREMIGKKCGQGCQQVLSNIPAVVDKTCDLQGRCVIPAIPQNFELCADMDPCTTLNCDQDTAAHTARCVKIGCAAGQCCCARGNERMCLTTAMCMGMGRACGP